MKTRFFLFGELGSFIFGLLFFCDMQANRSWILFDPSNNSQVYYTFNTNVFSKNLKTGSCCPIFNVNFHKDFSDIALNQEVKFLCVVGSDIGSGCLFKIYADDYNLDQKYCGVEGRYFLSQNNETFIGILHEDEAVKCEYALNESSYSAVKASMKLVNKFPKKEYLLKQPAQVLFDNLQTLDMTDDGGVVAMNFFCRGGLWVWLPDKNEFYCVSSGLGGDHFGDFALSPMGSYLCTISGHGAELWNVQEKRFKTVFRWDPGIEDFQIYTCPPQIEGWVFDGKIYYRSSDSDWFFGSETRFQGAPGVKRTMFWGDIFKAVFSSNLKYIFMLTRLRGYFEDRSEWGLKVYALESREFIKTIDLPQIKTLPRNIASSPDGRLFVILLQDGELVQVPLDL